MNREQIARVAHEINRAYCASLGDASQPAWDDAPEWQKQSALAGVDMHLANPDATPEQSHESWLAQKTADGWTYGEVKDAEKKEHPCFMPYADLPAEQRAKDYLFRAVVHSMKDVPAEALVAVKAAQVLTTDSAFTPIRYIGKRDRYTDGAYGTKITWDRGQTQPVPVAIAGKLLNHPDQYELGDPIIGAVPALPDVKTEQTDEEKTQETRDAIQSWTKAALTDYAQTHFRVKLDPKQSIANLRTAVTQMVDQFGVT